MNNNSLNILGQLKLMETRGYSAYEVAVLNGYTGTEQEWLDSLVGPQGPQGPEGKSAYQVAVDNGYQGTEEEWVNDFLTPDGYYNKDEVDLLLSEKPYYFNTLNDMKEADLSVGSYASTFGYYSFNDGGASNYIIVDDDSLTADGGSIINLTNGLKAFLIIRNDTINVKQFGAKGDGTTDDTVAIQNALNFRKNNYLRVVFNENSTYLMQGYVNVYSNTDIELNNATIEDCYMGSDVGHHNGLCFRNNIESVAVSGYGALKNINIKGGTLEGGKCGLMFAFLHAENICFENILFHNCFVGTHIVDMCGCKNIRFVNCNFIGNMNTDSSVNFREMLQVDYARKSSGNYWGEAKIGYDDLPTTDLLVDNCNFEKGEGIYYPNAIGTHTDGNTSHKNIIIRNCKFHDTETGCIKIQKVENILIENNTFYDESSTSRADIYAINIQDTNSTYTSNPPKNIKILNNSFIIGNGIGTLTSISIRGINKNLCAENIIIENNLFDSLYNSSTNPNSSDAIQVGNMNNVKISYNIFNKCKNTIVKQQGATLTNLLLSNNIFNYCRDFFRSYGDYNSEINSNITYNESDNIWTDEQGTINLNKFRCIISLSKSNTKQNNRVPYTTSDTPHITVSDDNIINIPKFIHQFKITTVCYITFNATGNKRISPFIRRNNIATDLIGCEKYSETGHTESIFTPHSVIKIQDLCAITTTITVSAGGMDAQDLFNKNMSNSPGTILIIEGY